MRGRQVECAVAGKNYLGRILPINDLTDQHHHDNLHPPSEHHSDHTSDEHHSSEHDDSHSNENHNSEEHHSNGHHSDAHHLDDHSTHIDKPLDHLPPYHYHPDHYYKHLHKDNSTSHHLDHHHDPRTNHTLRLNLDHKILQHQDLNNTTNYFNYPPHVDLQHLTHNYQTNRNQQSNQTTNNLTKHHHLTNHYNTHNYETSNKATHDSRYNVSNYLINSNKLTGIPRSLTELPHCDQIFGSNNFMIQSPNFPSNYPSNIYCRYAIQRPNNLTCAIDLTFVNFNLEEEDRCSKDYFEIDGARICGSLPPYHQRTYYTKLII